MPVIDNGITNTAPDEFIGYFTCTSYTNTYGDIMSIDQGATACFYAAPSKTLYHANEEELGKVVINDRQLDFEGTYGYRLVTNGSPVDLGSSWWSVTGNDHIPSFKITNNSPFPACSDFNVMPDSISKTRGCSFTINNIRNINSGAFSMGGPDLNVYYFFLAGNFTVKIEPYQLAAVPVGSDFYAVIQMQNAIIKNIGGKNFKFIKEAYVSKRIKITD